MTAVKSVYVASTFRLAKYIPEVEGVLNSVGWSIIDRWWAKDEKQSLPQNPREFYAEPVVQAIAARHWQAIRNCDAFLLVAEYDEITRFTGAAVEFGFAHALGKPTVVVGLAKLSAMWAPAIHCADLVELKQVMRDLNYSNERGG